jgi:hypothetical protein
MRSPVSHKVSNAGRNILVHENKNCIADELTEPASRFSHGVVYDNGWTLDDSPAKQERTAFLAGASGLLIRTQVWTSF